MFKFYVFDAHGTPANLIVWADSATKAIQKAKERFGIRHPQVYSDRLDSLWMDGIYKFID